MSTAEKVWWILIGIAAFTVGGAAVIAAQKDIWGKDVHDMRTAFLSFWLWWLVALFVFPIWLTKRITGRRPDGII